MDKLYEVAAQELPINKDDFKKWFNKPSGAFVVANLHPRYKEILDVESREVPITEKVLNKQKEHHPEIAWHEYLLINTLLNNADLVIRKGDDILVHIMSISGKSYFCVIRANAAKEKAFVASYRRTNSDDIKKEIKRGEIVWDKR